MSIGENVKRMRLKRLLSQRELADQVHVDQSMICQIERGSKAPSLPLGQELAKALGCSVEDFLK